MCDSLQPSHKCTDCPLHILVDKLSQHAVDRKWTTVLVRCQQPFNRNDQFGLSSLILSSSPEGIPSSVCVDINIRHHPSSHGTSTNASVVTKSDVEESSPPLMKKAKAGLPLSPQGAVMQRLMEDRLQRHHRASTTPRLKQEPKRIHLLKRNIPKSLCTSDFMESYKTQPSKEDSLDFSRINRAVHIGSMLGTYYSIHISIYVYLLSCCCCCCCCCCCYR